MDPNQLFVTLKPILGDITRTQSPSPSSKLHSQQWNGCKKALDKLISLLTTFPSIVVTDHPIPDFSSSTSFSIPPSYSSHHISAFNCVPYFIFTNSRDNPQTQILNHFCLLRCSVVDSLSLYLSSSILLAPSP